MTGVTSHKVAEAAVQIIIFWYHKWAGALSLRVRERHGDLVSATGALGLHPGAGPAGGLEMGSPVLKRQPAVKEGRAGTHGRTISLCLLDSEARCGWK